MKADSCQLDEAANSSQVFFEALVKSTLADATMVVAA
jgi:hypothetical protein